MENVGSSQKTENVAVSFSSEKETHTLRKSGIEVVGDVPWGTHLCQFYETKEDLIDILVPYFKAGLENNEFCMWVTSEPLSSKEAEKALRKAVPNLDRYLKRGQIEIVPHTEWYLKDGAFNLERVLNAWVDKLNQALAEGYDGIRVTGNTAWLEKKDWKNFADYEEAVNNVIGKFRMIAICTHSLGKCGALEVIDVVRNHQFALIRRGGEWELIESSELKQAKEALIRSETRLRNIFAASPDAITVSDLNGNIVECNQATLDMGGLSSKNEVIGKSALEFIAKTDHKRAIENLKKTIEQGSVKNIEYPFLAKDGREYPAELSSSVIKDPSGNPTGFVTITKDITERKKMEEALRKSEEKYRGIVELAPDGIATMNMKGVVTSVNTAFSRLTGFSKDELVGKHFTKLGTIRPRDLPKYIKLVSSIFRGKIPPSVEFAYLRKDGTQRYGEACLSFMKRSGKKVGVQAILRDITERKEMEEKLRQYSKLLEELVQKRTRELSESEKKYSVLVEEASDGVIILQDEKVIFSNKKFAEIIGYSRQESIGCTIEKLVDEKYLQLVKERYRRRLRGEKVPPTYEIELIAKTSERVPIELSAKRINYQGRTADLIIVRDIRERKLMEEQRLKLEKLATMSELATMVAHDLRNPLTSIRTASYYIKNTWPHHADAECKTALEMLDIIEQETLFADSIVNDLLDFAARRSLQKKRQNINKLVEASLMVSNIPENIKVKTKLAKKAIATIDAKQLERVFLNLIKNAGQAMPNGGKLTIKTSETKDHIEIVFTDTGVGIPEENMSKIFTPLFTTKAKGIGMGLVICKRIVEQHGGTIDVKSKVGKGTTFTIKLPKKGGRK